MDTKELYTPVDLRQSTKLIRKMRLKSNDVVLIKADTAMAKNFNIAAFSEAVANTGLDGIIVVIVDEFTDIMSLSEKEMRKHGWYKLSTAASAVMDRIMKEKDNNGEETENDSV